MTDDLLCGHPAAAVHTADEGTQHCPACEAEAREVGPACACRSDDAGACMAIRCGPSRDDDDRDEECSCSCHELFDGIEWFDEPGDLDQMAADTLARARRVSP
jgi:hypothetical protein